MNVRVVTLAPEDPLAEQAFALRRDVFVDEQSVDVEIEFDGLDDTALHLVVLEGDAVVATARLLPVDEGLKLGRMAVRAEQRGRGLGRRLALAAIDEARARGADRIVLHAQTQARGFYEKLGFVAADGEFDEAGIAHVRMTLVP